MAKIACADQTPPPAPSMTVTKTLGLYNGDPTAAAAGDVINYVIEVCNDGNTMLSNVVISDPSATTLLNGTAASLAPGSCMSATAKHTVTAADLAAGGVTNTATATAQDPTGASISASDTVTRSLDPEEPALTLNKQLAAGVVTPLSVGQIVPYEFVVTNTGDVPLSNIAVSDPAIASIAGSPIASLAVGASQTLSGSVTLTQAMVTGATGARTFANTATASGFSPSGANVTATDTNTSSVADVIRHYRLNPSPTTQPHACEIVLNNPQRIAYADGYHYFIDDDGTISLYNYASRTLAVNPTWTSFGGGGPLNGMTPTTAFASPRWVDIEDGWISAIDPSTDAMWIYNYANGASGGIWGVQTPLSGGPLAGMTAYNATNTPPAGYRFLGLLGDYFTWVGPTGCIVAYNEFTRIHTPGFACNLTGGGSFGGPVGTAVNGPKFIGVTDGWIVFQDGNNLQWYNVVNGAFGGQIQTAPLLPACQCWTCTNGTCVRTDATAANQTEAQIITAGGEVIAAPCA